MAGFEGRVRAVSETRSRPVTALESTRIVLFAVAQQSHWLARVFEPARNHREFHDETYSPGRLASPPGGRVLLEPSASTQPSAATALDFVRREQRGRPSVGCPGQLGSD